MSEKSPMVRLAGNGRGEYHLAIRALSMTGVPKGKAQGRLAQADLTVLIIIAPTPYLSGTGGMGRVWRRFSRF